jgi:hypothetical protein
MLLTGGDAFARPGNLYRPQPSLENNSNNNAGYGNSRSASFRPSSRASSSRAYSAPEIDAASGTSAIALLVGVLLLAGEKSRSKRR